VWCYFSHRLLNEKVPRLYEVADLPASRTILLDPSWINDQLITVLCDRVAFAAVWMKIFEPPGPQASWLLGCCFIDLPSLQSPNWIFHHAALSQFQRRLISQDAKWLCESFIGISSPWHQKTVVRFKFSELDLLRRPIVWQRLGCQGCVIRHRHSVERCLRSVRLQVPVRALIVSPRALCELSYGCDSGFGWERERSSSTEPLWGYRSGASTGQQTARSPRGLSLGGGATMTVDPKGQCCLCGTQWIFFFETRSALRVMIWVAVELA